MANAGLIHIDEFVPLSSLGAFVSHVCALRAVVWVVRVAGPARSQLRMRTLLDMGAGRHDDNFVVSFAWWRFCLSRVLAACW